MALTAYSHTCFEPWKIPFALSGDSEMHTITSPSLRDGAYCDRAKLSKFYANYSSGLSNRSCRASSICRFKGERLSNKFSHLINLPLFGELVSRPHNTHCPRPEKQRHEHRLVQAVSKGDINDGSVITGDGSNFQSTLRTVENAMLAATVALAYYLSSLLRLDVYFGMLFPLPIVISSLRWGAADARKTTLASLLLLLVLGGPIKPMGFLLLHGIVGLAFGTMWRWRTGWPLSVAVCTVVRCLGILGYLLISSCLLGENVLAMVLRNSQASLTLLLANTGSSLVPSLSFIYSTAGVLLLVNSGAYMFLFHIMYGVFLYRLDLCDKADLPKWLYDALD